MIINNALLRSPLLKTFNPSNRSHVVTSHHAHDHIEISNHCHFTRSVRLSAIRPILISCSPISSALYLKFAKSSSILHLNFTTTWMFSLSFNVRRRTVPNLDGFSLHIIQIITLQRFLQLYTWTLERHHQIYLCPFCQPIIDGCRIWRTETEFGSVSISV